jgi:hypothetical protein
MALKYFYDKSKKPKPEPKPTKPKKAPKTMEEYKQSLMNSSQTDNEKNTEEEQEVSSEKVQTESWPDEDFFVVDDEFKKLFGLVSCGYFMLMYGKALIDSFLD